MGAFSPLAVAAVRSGSLAFFMGCSTTTSDSAPVHARTVPPAVDARVQAFLGPDVVCALRGTSAASSFRLRIPFESGADGLLDTEPLLRTDIREAVVVARGRDLDRGEIEALRNLLLSPESYVFGEDKFCQQRAGVGVRLHAGEADVDVLLCFECNMLGVGRVSDRGWEDFDPVRSQLVRLAKALFPSDPDIQALRP